MDVDTVCTRVDRGLSQKLVVGLVCGWLGESCVGQSAQCGRGTPSPLSGLGKDFASKDSPAGPEQYRDPSATAQIQISMKFMCDGCEQCSA